jgi:hypothetical protein
VYITNSGYLTLSKLTLEGWPGLAAAVTSCTKMAAPQPVASTLQSASISPYESLQCQGIYNYTDGELYGGSRMRNVTVAAVSSLGKRVASTRDVYTSPQAPQPNARIRFDYRPGGRGCDVDMKGERGLLQA